MRGCRELDIPEQTLRFLEEQLTQPGLAAGLRRLEHGAVIDPDQIRPVAAGGHQRERALGIVKLHRSAADRPAEVEVADQGGLGEAVLARPEAGGGADQRLLAIGAHHKGGVQDGSVAKGQDCRLIRRLEPGEGFSEGGEVGKAIARCLERLGQLDVGEVPAEGRKTRLGAVEQRLGRTQQPASPVDDADLGQRVAESGGIADQSGIPEVGDAGQHQRRRALVARRLWRQVDRLEPGPGHRHGGGKARQPAADYYRINLLHSYLAIAKRFFSPLGMT